MIPNPWDAGSARVLEALGFEALATTSSGFAFTLGRLDGSVTLDEVVEHVRGLDEATSLPVSVDLENGYGPEPEAAATALIRAAGAGAVGGSIEDYDPADGLYELDHAVARVAAAADAARSLGFPFTFTARAENHIRGNPDLDDTIARLQAYERAGADVLYAPGLRDADQIRAVCEATGKPVNVLAHPRLTMAEIVAAGAQRVSVGGALAWVAAGALASAAEQIRDAGDFSVLRTSAPDPRVARLSGSLRGLPARGQPRPQPPRLERGAALLLRAGGPEEVGTFRTSGNVVFDGRPRVAGAARRAGSRPRWTGARLRGADLPALGEPRSTRSRRSAVPAKLVEASAGKLQVALLPGKPAASKRKGALALQTDDDRLAFGDRELYWLPSAGTMDSSLDRKPLDELVGPHRAHQGHGRAARRQVLRGLGASDSSDRRVAHVPRSV